MNESEGFTDKQRLRSRLKLLFIASIFFGPLIAAWVLYYGFPGAATDPNGNNGQLVNPARPLPQLSLQTPDGEVADELVFQDQRWTYLYFANQSCGDACLKRLYDTRQVRTALGKRGPRVQRIYIASDAQYLPQGDGFDEQHPDLELYVDKSGTLRDFLNESVEQAGANNIIYLVDPLGNWVLYYRPDDAAKGLLEDTKRLLKLSHIG